MVYYKYGRKKQYNSKKVNKGKKKYSNTKKKYSKYKNIGKKNNTMVMYNKFVQPKLFTRLRYCDTKTLTGSSGATHHWMRANSIFDPDYTGVGHSPCFHDQWQNLYKNYKVVACKWKFIFTPNRAHYSTQISSGGTAAGETHGVNDTDHSNMLHNPAIIFWEVNGDVPTPRYTEAADLNIIREMGSKNNHVQYRLTSPNPNKSYALSGYAKIRDILDKPDSDINSYEASAFGVNPGLIAYLGFGIMSKDGGTCSSYRVDLTLDYFVQLSGAEDVDES